MDTISVNHFATTRDGGAGTAMKRLNRALNRRSDVISEITTLYEGKYSSGYLRYVLNHVPIANKLLTNQLDRKFTPTCLPQISGLNPDTNIVHLHWVAGFLSPRTIKKIESPIVWTLHDMWPLTGGCHYANECDRFSDQCGQCPVLDSNVEKDISNRQFQSYQEALSEKDIYYIAVSEWMADKAEESSLICGPIQTIPNCLDTQHFAPKDQGVAREVLSIPAEANVILTGGAELHNPRKGGDLLNEALHHLNGETTIEDTIVLTFGGGSIEEVPFKTRSLGWVDTGQLPLVYSSADVMAVPSRYESFGQIAAEASSCGTPVVAFNTGGLSDIVVDDKTGFLVNKYNPQLFSKNLSVLLSDIDKAQEFGRSAREHAVASWSFERIAQKYRKIYENLHRENR